MKLGYPFDDPSQADYYGYHASMLSVSKEGEEFYDGCSYYYQSTDWCSWNNDNEGDSTFLSNWEDDTYDFIDEDLLHVSDAAGETFIFSVDHYYFARDYYTDDYYEGAYNDHMLTPTLTIDNLDGSDNWSGGWTKDVEKDVSTHIKVNGKWEPNPEYEGSFTVKVSCDSNCSCKV